MNPHCTIMINENAGIFHAKAGVDELRRLVAESHLDADVVVSTSPYDLRQKIGKLVREGCERIAVAGGDGTVHLAVQEMAGSESVLAIVPQGTANNFATALRLPLDLPSALRVLRDGNVLQVDLGKVRGEYFTESAGVGLFADALALYGAGSNKNFFRGLYAMLRVICSMKAHRLRLRVDGKSHTERAVLCLAANSYRMGAAFPVAPSARVTDGALDVVIIGDLKRSELIPYYRAFRAQLHGSLPKVTQLRAREVSIDAGRRLNVHCDDRVIGTTPVDIVAYPSALKVLVDRL